MFRNMRNRGSNGTLPVRFVADALQRRLPPEWRVREQPDTGAGAVLSVCAPDGRSAELKVVWRKRVPPRDVAHILTQQGRPGERILVAPFLSPRARELLATANVSFADQTGNLRVVVYNPAIFIEDHGADRDPECQPRALRSLKGPGKLQVYTY